MGESGFLAPTPPSEGADRLAASDLVDLGFVMNASRLWGRMPDTHDALFALLHDATRTGRLSLRERGILVTACASALGDAYCSLAWGGKLAAETGDADLAAGVLRADDAALDDAGRALAGWARQVARDPNATTAADVERLRAAGYDDDRIFAITVFVALRIAFSTVNDALGATPDAELAAGLPAAVREAVTYGRPVDAQLPGGAKNSSAMPSGSRKEMPEP